LAIVHAFQTTSKKAKAKRPDFFTSILGFPIQRNAGYRFNKTKKSENQNQIHNRNRSTVAMAIERNGAYGI
jgi:hypothetical protein